MLTTPNLGLKKPEDTDFADPKVFTGENMDTLDTAVAGKVNRSGDTITGNFSVDGELTQQDTTNDAAIRMVTTSVRNYIQSGNKAKTAARDLTISGGNNTTITNLDITATNVNITPANSIFKVGSKRVPVAETTGGTGSIAGLWTGTQVQYDQLGTKVGTTLYVIVG